MAVTKKRYVVGFLFDGEGQVALIHKLRPEWQKGRLNGIGGHIERGESPIGAMNREFYEEAGSCATWRQFCVISGSEYELHCFTSRVASVPVKSMTDERIDWYPVYNLPPNVIANLQWLVPMANYEYTINAFIDHESETC